MTWMNHFHRHLQLKNLANNCKFTYNHHGISREQQYLSIVHVLIIFLLFSGDLFSSGMEPDPELDFMKPKLTRSKSRKSFRKKRDQEPYKLLRKGSDKIKAVNNFRMSKNLGF